MIKSDLSCTSSCYNHFRVPNSYKGVVLLNCETLPGSRVNVFYSLDCKNGAIRFNYAACTHVCKIMPIMLALCSLIMLKIMLA